MVTTCWTPANHRYDGTCDNTRLVLPHYPTMPDFVRVYDRAVRHRGWTRWQRRQWRATRDKALARWGYPYVVKERGSEPYPDGGITLSTFRTSPGYEDNSYGGFGLAPITTPEQSDYDPTTWERAAGFALINDIEVRNAFASRAFGRLTGVICHEVGHALGFGHGGVGIMRDAVAPPYSPDIFELGALRTYWGTA